MKRDVRRDAITMTTSCYLIIASTGSLRMTATAPRLAPNEVSLKVEVKVPRALFTKPSLFARVEIPTDLGAPAIIDVKTIGNIQDAVRQATGLDLAVSVIPA